MSAAKRYTKELRQKIVEEFALKHEGKYDPRLFVEYVRKAGPEHPAYSWFTWDKDKAAQAYLVQEAQEFARDLRITFEIRTVVPKQTARFRYAETSEMPLVMTRLAEHRQRSCYYLTNPASADDRAEHCRQAAHQLQSWLSRFRSAVEIAGSSAAPLEKLIAQLQAVAGASTEAA